MEELRRIEKKRALYIQGNYELSLDSLNSEVINPEFIAIDRDLYVRRIRREYLTTREQGLLTELKAGQKIRMGSVC